MADAATARRRRGLPERSPYSAACSDRCDARREARFRREVRARGYELAPGDWRCDECGCTAAEAMKAEHRKLSAKMVVCSAECYRARVNRRGADAGEAARAGGEAAAEDCTQRALELTCGGGAG